MADVYRVVLFASYGCRRDGHGTAGHAVDRLAGIYDLAGGVWSPIDLPAHPENAPHAASARGPVYQFDDALGPLGSLGMGGGVDSERLVRALRFCPLAVAQGNRVVLGFVAVSSDRKSVV